MISTIVNTTSLREILILDNKDGILMEMFSTLSSSGILSMGTEKVQSVSYESSVTHIFNGSYNLVLVCEDNPLSEEFLVSLRRRELDRTEYINRYFTIFGEGLPTLKLKQYAETKSIIVMSVHKETDSDSDSNSNVYSTKICAVEATSSTSMYDIHVSIKDLESFFLSQRYGDLATSTETAEPIKSVYNGFPPKKLNILVVDDSRSFLL